MFGELPNDDTCGDGNVHGMLSAELWDFEATVGVVDDALVNALHLIAENNGIF